MKKSLAALAATIALMVPGPAAAFVLGTTTPGKWGDPVFGGDTYGTTVTYSFMPTGTRCEVLQAGCTVFGLGEFGPSFAVWRAEIQNAFAAWAAASNNFLRFIEVPDDGVAVDGLTSGGDIRLGGRPIDGPTGALSSAFLPPVNGVSAAGDILFDTGECWETVLDGPGDGCFNIFKVAAHDIGHSLGLADTTLSTALMGVSYQEAFTGPQSDDIEGIRFIYGRCPRDPTTGLDLPCTPIFESGPPTPSLPLPSTLWLAGLGLAALGLAARRRASARGAG